MSTHRWAGTATAVVAAALLAGPATAGAAVPYKTIASAGPLTNIFLGADGSCQINHVGDARGELYPSGAIPGDCGTFIVAGGVLYAPDFANHDGTATSSLGGPTPVTPVSQSDVSGAGTAASPYTVVTVFDAGTTGLRATVTDTYVTGQEIYKTNVDLKNQGGAAQSGVIYRAGDCYLQESDTGYGFLEQGKAPGCSINANNTPAGRIEQWFPLTAGSSYMESRFSNVWAAIGTKNPLPNTEEGAVQQDNGAGLSWNYSLAPGQSATFAHLTAFSPAGVTAGQQQSQQPPPTAGTPTAFGPNGILSVPSNRRCVSRRKFRIRVKKRAGLSYESVIVFVNNRRVAVRKGRRVTAPVDLRGLPKGTFTVKINVITSTGDIIRGVRRYKTCTKKQRGGNRSPV